MLACLHCGGISPGVEFLNLVVLLLCPDSSEGYIFRVQIP